MPLVATRPGAINLTSIDLTLDDIITIVTGGAMGAQTTLRELQRFIGGTVTSIATRVIVSNAQLPMISSDVFLLINKTVAGATNVVLKTPAEGLICGVKDMKGDAGSNNITLDAGSGNLINGSQTLVMNANYGTTWLIGMSATQWGTLI